MGPKKAQSGSMAMHERAFLGRLLNPVIMAYYAPAPGPFSRLHGGIKRIIAQRPLFL
jgi:hypothetical protein